MKVHSAAQIMMKLVVIGLLSSLPQLASAQQVTNVWRNKATGKQLLKIEHSFLRSSNGYYLKKNISVGPQQVHISRAKVPRLAKQLDKLVRKGEVERIETWYPGFGDTRTILRIQDGQKTRYFENQKEVPYEPQGLVPYQRPTADSLKDEHLSLD